MINHESLLPAAKRTIRLYHDRFSLAELRRVTDMDARQQREWVRNAHDRINGNDMAHISESAWAWYNEIIEEVRQRDVIGKGIFAAYKTGGIDAARKAAAKYGEVLPDQLLPDLETRFAAFQKWYNEQQ